MKKIMSEKLSFLFYYNWEEQFLELDDDSERWNLLHNILKFETDRELDFQSKGVKHAFLGMKHGLMANQKKYHDRAEKNRINGRKHTGKNKLINEITQSVISEPNEPDKSKEVIVNNKEVIVNCEEVIVNSEELIDKSQISNDNGKGLNEKSEKEPDERVEDENTLIREPLLDRLSSIENWKEELVILNTGKFIDTYENQLNLDLSDKIQLHDILNRITPNE